VIALSLIFQMFSILFPDQFYFDRLNCAVELKKNIIVSIADEAVMQMLNAVAKTQTKKRVLF
jgi:hypothetical protein